uniref:UBZ4-type domain-containing protein n=1 Tax=Ciona savignyi TaxID=51511 RepID=H2ZFN4_CIOSA
QLGNITLLNQHLDKCLLSNEDKISTGHAQDCTVIVENNTNPSVQESCSKKPYTTVENSIKPVSENETQIFICPICNKSFDASNTSLHQFNCHMDTCLSHGAIRDLLKADNEDSFKRPCPNNNFNENISKRRKVVSKIKPKQGIIKFFER